MPVRSSSSGLRRSRLFTTSAFGALALAAVLSAPASAQLNQGATPAQSNGSAPTIDQSVPNTTTVTLGGSRTVIDWDKFDINSGERADFIFADRSDIVLNRVGGAGSTINGDLNGLIGAGGPAGGNIWIYNANGVVIGANARINTGGLLVTTAAIDRADDATPGGFLDGSSTGFGFTGAATGSGITVRNGAQVNSHGGAIALVSTTVTAEAGSSISAQDGGNVLIGSAAKYKIRFRPTSTDDLDLLSFEVASAADGTNSNNGTELAGSISGNRVFVATIAKTGLTNQIINTGAITATDAALDETGAIVLSTGHNIVNGAASSATFVTDAGYGDLVTGTGASGSLTASKISLLASNTLYANGTINAGAGTVDLVAHYGGISNGFGANNGITAGMLTADANYGITLQATNHIAKLGDLTVHDTGSLFIDEIYVQNQGNLEISGDIRTAAGVTLYSPTGTFSGTGRVYAGKVSVMGRGLVNVDSATRLAYADSYGDLEVRSNGDLTVGLDGSSSQNNIVRLTANSGAITQTGGAGLTGTVIANALGDIKLSASNSFSNVSATSANAGAIALNATGNLDFKVSTGTAVQVTTGGDATASGTNAISAGQLSIAAGGRIAIDTNGDAGAVLGGLGAGGSITIAMDGNLSLADDVNVGPGEVVSLTSRNGSISQAAGTINADWIKLNAGTTISQGTGTTLHSTALSLTSGGNVTLAGANDFASLYDLAVGGDLTLRNAGTINLDPTNSGGYTSDGALTLTSDTGNITAGNIVTTSKLTASAVNGDILLGGSGQQIGSLGTMTAGGSIEIGTSRAGFSLTGDIAATNLTLLAQNGGIAQNAGTTIAAGTLNATANGDIMLDQANAVTTVSGLNASLFTTGHNISFRNAGDVTLGGVVDATGGTLRLTSNTGGISQNSGASVYIRADQLFLSGASDLLLNSTGNNIATLGGASSTNGGILYRDANGFDIAGNITATSGGASLRTASAGSITQSGGVIDVDYLGVITIGSGNSVTLNQANRIRRLIATAGNGTLSINSTTDVLIDQSVYFDTISLRSGGAITQSNTGSFAAGTANLSAVTGINLPGASFIGNNSIQNFGTITNTASGGINIVSYSGSHTSLTGDISAAGQTVSITDVAGYILQTGGVITADTLNLSATGGINVGDANQVSNLGAMSGAGLSFANAGSFNVTQSIDMTGAHLNLMSNSGAITQNAGTTLTADTMALNAGTTISQGTGATLHATSLSLTSGGNASLGEANDFTTLTDLAVGGDLTLRNLGNINLSPILGGTGGYRSGGALTLISDTGNILTTNSGIATSRLTVSAAGSISLDGTIASLGTIAAGQSILLSTYNGSMELTGNVTGRSVSLYADTGLSQSGGIIDADRLNVITNGAISLTGANQIDVVGRLDTDRYDFGTGHDITLRNVGAIVLDYQIEAPDGTVTLTSDTGGISQTGFSDRFIARTLNASAAGDIVLDYAGNDLDHLGAIRSTGGAVTIVDTDAFDLTGQVRAAGTLSLSAGGAITRNGGLVVAGGALNVSATSVDLVAGGNIQLGTINTNGNFAIDTDGDLRVTGTIDTQGNITTLNAAFGAIQHGGGRILNGSAVATALNGINLGGDNRLTSFSGSSTGGGNIVFNNGGAGAISVALHTSGGATLTAGGNLSSGGITVDSLSVDAGHIDLTSSVDVNSFTRLVAAYGDVLVTNAGSFTVDGDVTTNRPGLRTIDLRANGGGITQTAGTISGHYASLRGAGDLIQSGTARVDANAAYFSGANLLLGGANNLVSNDTRIVATGGLTLRNAGSIDLTVMGGYTAGGALSLTSDSGSITAASAVTASALTALAANGAVSFSHSDNLIPEIRGLSAGTNATMRSRNGGFTLTGDVDVGGTLSLQAGTGINQTGGRIRATTLDAQLYQSMATGSVLLGGANDVDNLYVLAASGGGDLLYRDVDGFRVTYAVVGNRVTLTSDAGAITQASGYMDGVQASQLTVSAVDGIALNNEWNGIRTILGLTNTGSGGIDVGGRGVNMVVGGNVSAAGQAVSLTARNASLTQTSGGITAGSLSASAASGIALTSASNNVAAITGLSNGTGGIAYTDADGFSITGDINAAGQALSLRMMGASAYVTQNSTSHITAGRINLAGGAAFGLTGHGGVNNQIAAIGDIGSAAQIYTTGNVDLTGTINSPYFELWAQGGDVTQSGGHIDNSAPGNYLEVRANNIALTSAANRLGTVGGLLTWGATPGTISAVSTGNTNFQYLSGGGVSLTVTGGNLTSNSGALDVDSLAADASGTIALNGRIGTLGNITAGGDASFGSTSNLDATGTINVGGRLTFNSGGTFTRLSGSIAAGGLQVNAAGAITIYGSNGVGTIYGLTTQNGSIFYSTNSGFALAGDITAGGGNAVALNSSLGSITQTAGIITAARLDASARNQIALTRANQVGQLGNLAASGAVSFTARDDYALVGNISGGSVTLISTDGAIDQSGGSISTANLSASASTGLDLFRANSIGVLSGLSTTTGDLRFRNIGSIDLPNVGAGGKVTLQSDGGTITQAGGIVTAAALDVSAAQDIVLGDANRVGAFAGTSANGDIIFRNTGSVSLGPVVLSGAFTLTSDAGAVTQTGDLTAGELTVIARDGISLTRSGNAAGALVNLTNLGTGGVAYTDSGSILIGAIGAAGQAVTLSAGGDIDEMTGIEAATLNLTAPTGDVTLSHASGNLIGALGAADVRRLTLATAGDLDLAGAIAASDALSLTASGRLTQSAGHVTTPSLSLLASGGIDLGETNQVDALTATNSGGSGDIRFVNGRSLTLGNLVSDHGDAILRLTAGQLTLGADIFSLGNIDIEAADGIGGTGALNARQSVRVVSDGSIDLALVSGRDDILIDAGGDAAVRQLVHLSGAPDAAGNGYKIDILGNNVTLGANNPNAITAVNRLYAETSPVVRLGARAGNATLNLMTMNRGVSIAATGDVRAHAASDLSLVDILGANVSLTSEAGDISASRVDVAGDYSLTGRSFDSGALQPLGARAGTWTLTGSAGLDALGRTLEYGGNIDFTIDGAFENGSVRSLAGGVTISADALDLHQISAATGIDAQATLGDLELFSADTAAGNLDLTAAAVRVSGSLAAGADIAVTAATGDAVIGYATAGRNIGISAAGDAKLRQANLTGATGDLTIGAGGNAVLGDDDALSGIGTDRWFERAAGSTGTATITGGNGAFVNLDHSATLDSLTAALVAINVASGNLAIGQLTATTHGASVDVANGSLIVGNASAANGTLDLIANDDLTLSGGASALEIYLTAGDLLDTSAAPVNGTDYVELTGGAIRAGTIASGGDIDAFSTAGAIAADSVHSTGGNAIFNAFTDLGLGNVIASGGQLQAGGNAAVRAITAPDGFALVALGNVTLGADTADLIAGGNLLVTGGNGSGGATLISLGGDVRVNLQSATGVFATIASAVDGDANVHVATGNLEIGDLAGHNIAVTLPGGTLTVMNPVSSGGNYTLTARDFGGNALLPAFGGGATKLNNVSITDTDGDLGAGGALLAAGDIRVTSVGNITGTLSLLADGDVEVAANAIRLGDVTGRDVVLSASVAGVDVVGAVTIGRNYTLTGTDFSANALAAGGARLGDLFVTDTAGDFAYGALDLGFGGTATIRANSGAIRGGNIATLGNLSLSATGVEAGILRSDQGGVDVDSRAGVDLAGVRASNAISVNADGNLRLGHAELTGTGVNSFTLAAGGDLLFGAADAASIGSGHAFTSAGSAMTGGGLRADGAISVNLDRSARLTGIDGGILELTVRNGDLAIGDIRTVGAMFVNGPSGALTIGDAETSAGHIGIAGQGDVTTGAISGRFVVDIGSSAGSVSFRKVTGGDVTLAASGGIAAVGPDAGVFADSLTLSAGGDVDLATGGTGSRIGSLRAVTVANGDFALHNLQDLALDGAIDVRGGTLDLQVAGALSQNSGAIRAQRLIGSVSGHARLDGANNIASLGNFNSDGLLLNNMTALGIDGVVDGGAGSVTIRARGGMTIAATGAIRSASTGDAITLASDGRFRNLAGEAALGAANGRWLVYTQALGNPGAADPANDFGGLGGRSFYGAAYDFAAGGFAAAPTAGNRFVYGYRPVLTVRPNDVRVTYDGQIPVPGASIGGLINGDRAADAWSGAAGFSGAGRNAGIYTVAANLGSLVSDMNYDFTFGTGTLWIDPRAITATLAANGKIYDGTANATGTLSLGGVVAGDDVAALGTLAFADKNAGLGKTVTATGITISGADAGNYIVDATAIGLADIARRSLSATLAANGKTYDGTTDATGTLSLGGIVAGDQVGVTGGIAFDSRNAGVRTATASGLTLNGADAGNYAVTGTVTDTATIARLGITGTATADSRVYDGTVAATGRIALNGVLAGDAVVATAGYIFADPNAGAGRSVSVNGLALTGADAGNYMVMLSANPIFADILLRPMTVAADDLTKLFGQRDPALTWRILGGSLVGGDAFTGGLTRDPGEQAGSYAIGRGSLGLSSNYALTFVPGSLTIRLTQSGADASDAIKRLRPVSAFALDADPSANLEGDADTE